jgi:fucose permease
MLAYTLPAARPREQDAAVFVLGVALAALEPTLPALDANTQTSLGLFTGPVFATVTVLARRHTTITDQSTGAFLVRSSLGGMCLPWLIGQLFVSAGPQVLLVAVLVDLALALGALVAFLWQLAQGTARARSAAACQPRG